MKGAAYRYNRVMKYLDTNMLACTIELVVLYDIFIHTIGLVMEFSNNFVLRAWN